MRALCPLTQMPYEILNVLINTSFTMPVLLGVAIFRDSAEEAHLFAHQGVHPDIQNEKLQIASLSARLALT
jgi:hypothetical protein